MLRGIPINNKGENMSDKKTLVVPARTEKEPYTITEAMKNAAAERRKVGKPKNKAKKKD